MPGDGASYVVTGLVVYPVKGCQGVHVQQAEVDEAGLVLDRAYAVVDATGARYEKNEVLSPRRLPALLTIETAIEGRTLVLRAPGMGSPLRVCLDAEEGDAVDAKCSDSARVGGWSLGKLEGRAVGAAASTWLSAYLNVADSAKAASPPTEFALVRTRTARAMRDYPPTFPILEGCRDDPRFARSSSRYHDFAPFLLTNEASLQEAARLMSLESYPMGAFRANLIVSSPDGAAWEEESFGSFRLGELELCVQKRCPRCTMTLREPEGGAWVVPGDKLLLHKALKQAFPDKAEDPEWGSWRGATFGVFTGYSRVPPPGTIVRVGDGLKLKNKSRQEGGDEVARSAAGWVQLLQRAASRAFASRSALALLVLLYLFGRRLRAVAKTS